MEVVKCKNCLQSTLKTQGLQGCGRRIAYDDVSIHADGID